MSQPKTKLYKTRKISSSKKNRAAKRDGTLPIDGTLEKIKGYKTLTIYRMERSPFYYVRLYEERKVIRKCTKETDRKAAIKFAERFFVEIKSKIINKQPLSRTSGFEVCAYGLQDENKQRVERGELSEKKYTNDEYRLKKDILPYFRRYEVQDINYRVLSDFVKYLNEGRQEKKLSLNSIKVYLSQVKTVLRYAQRMEVITTLPAFPTIKTIDTARSWFNNAEYSRLHNTARTHIGDIFPVTTADGERVLRTGTLTREIYDLILFMTNTFIRPTDIRVLKHKHIAVVKKAQTYLRLSHPATKSHAQPIVSLPKAVEVYESLRKRQTKDGFGKEDDYVFQPEHLNRSYALQQLYRQFEHLLKITNLKETPSGESRTLYSLRHTAIMFRLTESQGLDVLSLARNARTSVEMIDRFYAKHLTAEMNIEKIQSMRREHQ